MLLWQKVRQDMMADKDFAEYSEEMQVAADIAKAIMELRMTNGWTQKELAKRAGVSQADISRYENMEKLPNVATLKKIAAAGNCALRVRFEVVGKDN